MIMFQIKQRIKQVTETCRTGKSYTANKLVTTYYLLFIPIAWKEVILTHNL